MLHADKIVWMDEPGAKYGSGAWSGWPRFTTWRFKIKDCDTEFIMGVEAHETYLAEKAILVELKHNEYRGDMKILSKLIEEYGNKRSDEREANIHDQYNES